MNKPLPRYWSWILPSVGALFMAVHFGVCTQDDAFISFRYAENWANGLGWVFNPNEYVEGYSNPLWTLLFGVVFLLGGDPVHWSLLFGYGSIIFLTYSTFHLATTFQISSLWLWLGLLIVALDPSMVLESVQGLESVFYAGLVPLMVSLAIRERQESLSHRWSLVSAILLCLTRPEAPLFVGLLYTGLWLCDRDWRRTLIPLSIIGLQLALMTGLRLWYFGDPLPNTFYAKVGGWSGMRGVQYCVAHAKHHPLMWLGLIGGLFPEKHTPSKHLRLLYWVLLPYLFYVVSIGGDFKPTSRFLLPMAGLATVLLMFGLQTIKSKHHLWAGGLLSLMFICRLPLFNKAETWALDRRNNLVARKVVGEWLDQYTPPDTVLAMHSIGVVPFYAQRHTIDMWGLTDRTIAKTPNEQFGQGMAGHEKTNPDYVFSKHPDLYLPEDGFFQPHKKMQTPEEGFPNDFTDFYRPISIPIEGSWLNIWVHKRFKEKGGFGEWKKSTNPAPN